LFAGVYVITLYLAAAKLGSAIQGGNAGAIWKRRRSAAAEFDEIKKPAGSL